MLQQAYLLAKIDADTAENEQDFAEIMSTSRDVTGPRRCTSPAVHVAGGRPRAENWRAAAAEALAAGTWVRLSVATAVPPAGAVSPTVRIIFAAMRADLSGVNSSGFEVFLDFGSPHTWLNAANLRAFIKE